MRLVSLVVLFVQSTTMVLFMRATLTADGPKYRPTTAVVLSELVKVMVCVVVCYFQMPGDSGKFQSTFVYISRCFFSNEYVEFLSFAPSLCGISFVCQAGRRTRYRPTTAPSELMTVMVCVVVLLSDAGR